MLNVEIKGAGLVNRGAAMMLESAVREVRRQAEPMRVLVAPADHTLPFEERIKLGLWHRANKRVLGVNLGALVDRLPERLAARYGFVQESRVDVVLDASGFAYSDQWGIENLKYLAGHTASTRRRNGIFVFLPQAFGPFGSDAARRTMRAALDDADLVFARDASSLAHLHGLGGDTSRIRLAPDFTATLPPVMPEASPLRSGALRNAVAIVPNVRMLDKSDAADQYRDFLKRTVDCVRESGRVPFLLVHEGADDASLAGWLAAQFSPELDVVDGLTGAEAKGLISCCAGVVSGRYHALVSALSQGVPAIGTSWSHKYAELFSEYSIPDALVGLDVSQEELARRCVGMFGEADRDAVAARLEVHAERVKGAIATMWSQVFETMAERRAPAPVAANS